MAGYFDLSRTLADAAVGWRGSGRITAISRWHRVCKKHRRAEIPPMTLWDRIFGLANKALNQQQIKQQRPRGNHHE